MLRYFICFFILSAYGQVDFDEFFKNQRQRFEQFDEQVEKMMQGSGLTSGLFSGTGEEIIKNISTDRTDNKKIIVNIEFVDLKKYRVNVKVKDGQIIVESSFKKESTNMKESNETQSFYQSSSSMRSFPVPEDVTSDEAEITSKNNTISVIFKSDTSAKKINKNYSFLGSKTI